MKNWYLFSSIFQLVVGIVAIIAYIVLAASSEHLRRWTITLMLAISFFVMGAIGIIDHIKSNKK